MGKFKVGDRVVQDFTKDCCNLVEHWNDYWKRTEGALFDDGFVITKIDRSYVTYSNRIGGSGPSIGESYFKPAPFKIEVGKFYRTRGGQKVGPVTLDPNDDVYPFGAKEGFGPTARMNWYTSRGFYWSTESQDRLDLIAEWIDEPAVASSNDNAAKPKFKVGDAVKNPRGWNRFYTVTKIEGDHFWIDVFGMQMRYDFNGIEWLVEPAKPAPTNPAIVALIENGQPRPSVEPFVHADEASASKEAGRLASKHKGQSFGVYVLTQTVKEDIVYTYKHEWQRLAANGDKIPAIKALREITGLGLKATKDAVEYWIANDQQYSRVAA